MIPVYVLFLVVFQMDMVRPRTLKGTTPPGTPPSYEGERGSKERSRSLSGGARRTGTRASPPAGGGRKKSAHTSPPPALLDSSMVCAVHQKYFEFYCEDSLTPLCVDCANEPYHAMKGIVRLTEVEAKLKVSMKTSHYQASIKHRELHHRRAALKDALQNIQNQSTIAIRKINQRKDFTYEMLQRIASSMIAHVRSTALGEQQKIEDELAHIEESMKQTKRQHGAMNAVLHATPSTEFIKQAKVVLAENENNQVQKFSSPVQGIHTLEFLPALISINDPSRAQVLIEDCLLGHLKRRSEEIFMPSDSMLNVFEQGDGRGFYYSPNQLGASFYGTQYHDESISSISSFRSLQIGDRDDELSLGSDFEDEEKTRSKSEPDLAASKESAQAQEHEQHEEVLSFTVNKEKPILPPATASFIGSVPISSIKPALEEVLDICQSADGIWICGHYTPERWKTPHLCICKLTGSDQKVALVYDIDAKDASRPAVLLDSNGKLIYAKRKDWRIFEINPNDPKQRPTVTYSMVTQRIGALTGAGKHMFFSDVSPENQGCIQFLKWKSSDLRYKRTVHTNLNTASHETIHLGLVCSPISPSPSRAPDPTSPVSPTSPSASRAPDPASRTPSRFPAEEQEPEVCMLIVSDSGDEKNVIAVDTDGYVHWQLAGHSSELLRGGDGFEPAGVCADNRCNVYIADRTNSRILVVTPNGKDVHCLLDRNQGIEEPSKLCLAMDGQQLAVLNKKGHEIALYDIDIR